ncbi:MAG: endonuclease/exonuclease/phosphatase family protein [Acidobacteriota bacterium]
MLGRMIRRILCLSLLSVAAIPTTGITVSVMSFNIRYGTAPDGEDSWDRRRDLVCDVLRQANPDFVGLQEALDFQIDQILAAIPGYAAVGAGRDDGARKGEHSSILYRDDRWQVDVSGTFWLSDTPGVPGSRSWGNRIPRIVTWGRFVERSTGDSLWLFNTHFDHQSQASRERSAELLARRIDARNPRDPVIVTGDLNAGEDNPAVLHLLGGERGVPRLVDTFRVLYPQAREVGTFHGFKGGTTGAKIDYVLAEPGFQVLEAAIRRDHRDGRYPSDHYPVTATLALPR